MSTTVDAPEGPGTEGTAGTAGRWDRATVTMLTGFFAGSAGAAALVTALGKQVYDLSGRELDLGWLGLAEFAPAAVLVLVTGTIADRFDRRRVSSLGSLGEAVVTVLVTLYVATSPTAVAPLFGLALGLGVARSFVAPASRALPADTVPSAQLPWLVARWTIVFQVALIFGPVMAGSLYAVDPRAPFAAAAVLFFVASAAFWLLPPSYASRSRAVAVAVAADSVDSTAIAVQTAVAEATATALAESEAPPGAAGGPGRLHEALEGLRLVRHQPILLGAISLDLFAVLFGGAVALLPAIAEERLGVGAVGFGWLRAAPGIGAATMMLLLAIRPLRRHVGRALLLAVAVFGLATVLLGVTTSYVVAFGALVVLAGADALSVFIRITLVPLVTPSSARGRVMAVENVFIGASNELGAFESGVTGQLLGPALAVGLGGVATLVVAATWARLFPALRDVDRFPTPVDEVVAVD
ncbi:MAG TPA: MFS transporter [Acidimicrobiales bacterium]|nr:MFS transporter [Acidimicrobiales bacterium]